VRALDRRPHKIAAAIVEFLTDTLPAEPYRLSKCSTPGASSTAPTSIDANDQPLGMVEYCPEKHKS
jgi:hypothetical protein